MPKSATNRERLRSRSRGKDIDDADSSEEIPSEFFCPISKKFISDPVRIPTSDLTFDRDSVKDLHKPEDILADLRVREIMEEWFSQCDLEPAYDFISNQEELVAATKSVVEKRSMDILSEFAAWIKYKPSLLSNGGIRCVDMLLSRPRPSDSWVSATLSILAQHKGPDEELLVPEGIHPEYSLLRPISRAFKSQNEEFQRGLIKLIYALVAQSPDISAMAPKLRRILKHLISYLWPIRNHLIFCYAALLLSLLGLSANRECSECMFDAGLIDMAFVLLDFATSTSEEITNNPDQLSASLALGISFKVTRMLLILTCTGLLDRLSDNSVRARKRIARMDDDEASVLNKVMAQSL